MDQRKDPSPQFTRLVGLVNKLQARRSALPETGKRCLTPGLFSLREYALRWETTPSRARASRCPVCGTRCPSSWRWGGRRVTLRLAAPASRPAVPRLAAAVCGQVERD